MPDHKRRRLVDGLMPRWERRILKAQAVNASAECTYSAIRKVDSEFVRGFIGRWWERGYRRGRFVTAMGRPVLQLIRDEAERTPYGRASAQDAVNPEGHR